MESPSSQVRNWKDFVISFMGPEAAKRTVESLKKAGFRVQGFRV